MAINTLHSAVVHWNYKRGRYLKFDVTALAYHMRLWHQCVYGGQHVNWIVFQPKVCIFANSHTAMQMFPSATHLVSSFASTICEGIIFLFFFTVPLA
jgi:hypothetical protein